VRLALFALIVLHAMAARAVERVESMSVRWQHDDALVEAYYRLIVQRLLALP
jgi:hypothetical protein